DFPFLIKRLLPAGSYRAEAVMRFAGRLRRASTTFRLVAPNSLPSARLAFKAFKASGHIGSGADVPMKIANLGKKPGTADVRVALAAIVANQPSVEATKTVTLGQVGPGQEKTVNVSLGKLKKG